MMESHPEKELNSNLPIENTASFDLSEKASPRMIFALDIGTRKVMGIVARIQNLELEIVDLETREHPTRSMSAGQIEDVAEVSLIVRQVVEALSQRTGEKITETAIAIAGRNLRTLTGKYAVPAPLDGSPFGPRELNEATLKALEEALLKSSSLEDASRSIESYGEDTRISEFAGKRPSYSCVGYVVSRTLIDSRPALNPIGRYGRELQVEILASFLPYEILESQIDVLESLGLSASSITLEPIAALQSVVSRDLRRLDLALVDIGAGTSDIAFVSEGAIRAFAMVPQAGDAVTERIADSFLLDFLNAEDVKKKFSMELKKRSESDREFSTASIESRDIFQRPVRIAIEDIQKSINPVLVDIASRIAGAIVQAGSGKTPQAVLCVGGGSLTPGLAQMLAEALEIPHQSVGLSRPIAKYDSQGISKTWGPETATPLGIAEIAAANKGLRFKKVFVNERRTFVLDLGGKPATALSALVAAGLPLKTLLGWPGLSKTFTINGKFRICKPRAVTAAQITINGKPASLESPLNESDSISYRSLSQNSQLTETIGDAIGLARSTVFVNEKPREIPLRVFLEGIPVSLSAPLKDRMKLTTLRIALGDILTPEERSRGHWRVNGEPTPLAQAVQDGDRIDALPPTKPYAAEAARPTDHYREGSVTEPYGEEMPLPKSVEKSGAHPESVGKRPTTQEYPIESSNATKTKNAFTVTIHRPAAPNASLMTIPRKEISVLVNGQSVKIGKIAPVLADALGHLRLDGISSSGKKLNLLLNGRGASFTSPLQNGAAIEVFFE